MVDSDNSKTPDVAAEKIHSYVRACCVSRVAYKPTGDERATIDRLLGEYREAVCEQALRDVAPVLEWAGKVTDADERVMRAIGDACDAEADKRSAALDELNVAVGQARAKGLMR